MHRILLVLTTIFLLTGGTALFAQAPPPPADRDQTTRARATDPDVTYGRVKEFTAGQKIVIDVDNAPDKEFDLADKDLAVKLEKGLKTGDPVKVTERSEMGKTKAVMIAKHTGGGVTHGDKPAKNQ
jgi:hypothetical protein